MISFSTTYSRYNKQLEAIDKHINEINSYIETEMIRKDKHYLFHLPHPLNYVLPLMTCLE